MAILFPFQQLTLLIQMSLSKYSDGCHQVESTQNKNITATTKTASFEQNFTIYLRVKPILSNPSQTQSLRVLNNHEVQILPPYFCTDLERVFRYSEVFDQKADNLEVFNKTVVQPIKNVLAGRNSTVFIYGMTGAGKTHTMFHHIQTEDLPQHQGLVGLALAKIFQDMKKETSGKFQMTVSFYEIYNQNIRDLLAEGAQTLNIMEDPLKGVIINELVELEVKTTEQAKKAVQQGMARRAMNATKNNEVSSRSHAILQFTIRHYTPRKTPGEVELRQSKLFLVDLAGNEKACGQNKRFVEGVNINKSLLTLGKCISILAQQKKAAFIPFRDSKLTRILKDSLGGNSKTVMIACVSCENRFYEQTLNTLKYSSKAKHIKNSNTGGSLKMVSSRQMPTDIVNDGKLGGGEVYINNFVVSLQQILKQKLKISNMREQLTQCYHLNEKEAKNNSQSDAFTINMKQICNILLRLSDRQRQMDGKLQEAISKFTSEAQKRKDVAHQQQIKAYQLMIEKQADEIEKLKNIEQLQRTTLNQNYESGSKGSIELSQSSVQPQFKPDNQEKSIQKINTPSCLSHKNSFILIHQNSNHSENKFKNTVSINLASCKNASNKENVMMNTSKRSDSSKSSALSLVKKQDGIGCKKAVRPTIDLSVQLIKLKSPQMRESLTNKPSLCTDNNEINNKKEFLSRLKNMEKNSSNYSRAMIGQLLQEFDDHGYEISKMERSMLNKLRFMFKNRDLQSGNSVSNLRMRDKSVGRL